MAGKTAHNGAYDGAGNPAHAFKICVLPGDGIGPEIMAEARKVLEAVGQKHATTFTFTEALLGGVAIDATGVALPPETLVAAKASDAVLLAAVGGPQWDTTDPSAPRPEQGLLGIRKALGLYCNLRPVKVFDALADASTLKRECVAGVDLVIVRELTGGLYFGARGRTQDEPGCGLGGAAGQRAFDTMEYQEYEIERIVRRAFDLARTRRKKVTSVDKANILATSRLWRAITSQVAGDYPDVSLEHMLVDNAAMQLVRDPSQFDVLVTENMFGDILSDEAAQLAGSLGMLASASLGEGVALYEPTHGSAPSIAGHNSANPLAQILCVELMLRESLGMHEAANDVARAVKAVLDEGWRTADIAQANTAPGAIIGTAAMGDRVVARL
ncbi:MAG: 3-isopropylmalate dehydrogenase [Raoultibacter sp.]